MVLSGNFTFDCDYEDKCEHDRRRSAVGAQYAIRNCPSPSSHLEKRIAFPTVSLYHLREQQN
jgi:hypothetical protein